MSWQKNLIKLSVEKSRLWRCLKCGHEVISDEQPAPIRWTDDHVCRFVPAGTESSLNLTAAEGNGSEAAWDDEQDEEFFNELERLSTEHLQYYQDRMRDIAKKYDPEYVEMVDEMYEMDDKNDPGVLFSLVEEWYNAIGNSSEYKQMRRLMLG